MSHHPNPTASHFGTACLIIGLIAIGMALVMIAVSALTPGIFVLAGGVATVVAGSVSTTP